jgi:hypothetical protein
MVRKNKLSCLSLLSMSIAFKRVSNSNWTVWKGLKFLFFTDVYFSTMGVYDHSLDCTYTEPSTCISNYIQSYSPSLTHNTSCDRNLSFFLLFFLICSLNYMHLYTHSRADWHSSISERRRREREREFRLHSSAHFLSPSISYVHTSVPVYIYACPRIEHLFHFSHGQCIVIDEYEYITQMEEQTPGSIVIWSKKILMIIWNSFFPIY